MRVMAAICFALLLSVTGFAESTTTPTAFFGEGNALLDSSGNLIVVEEGRSTTGVTITGLRHSFYMPLTMISVISKGASTPTTVQFNGSVQVIGVGDSAIYAIGTTYTVSGTTLTTAQSLIAITASLPAGPALTGFPSFALTSPVDARVGPSDYISIISQPSGSTARTATVLHFASGAFSQVSSATLP